MTTPSFSVRSTPARPSRSPNTRCPQSPQAALDRIGETEPPGLTVVSSLRESAPCLLRRGRYPFEQLRSLTERLRLGPAVGRTPDEVDDKRRGSRRGDPPEAREPPEPRTDVGNPRVPSRLVCCTCSCPSYVAVLRRLSRWHAARPASRIAAASSWAAGGSGHTRGRGSAPSWDRPSRPARGDGGGASRSEPQRTQRRSRSGTRRRSDGLICSVLDGDGLADQPGRV